MRRARTARLELPAIPLRSVRRRRAPARQQSRGGSQETPGLRERKKARLRQQIVTTALRLFCKRGYENTRVDDICEILEISQPTFFRYFPSKDAVLRDVGRQGYACMAEHLECELSSKAATAERLRRVYARLAREVESNRPLWQAVVLSGAMDPVRSPEIRGPQEAAVEVLREILAQGQKRGEVTRAFPLMQLSEFMEALYRTVVRYWAAELAGPRKLSDQVRGAVDFFLCAVEP
jgi:AcrR family transcriptional regulator